jgi:hypothetical protein
MRLLLAGFRVDFTVECQGIPFRVHEDILDAGSDSFRAMIRGNYNV